MREYPKGRINGEDDGAHTYGIATDPKSNRVIINFFKPIVWIGLDAESGMNLLMGLARHLSNISGKVISVSVDD